MAFPVFLYKGQKEQLLWSLVGSILGPMLQTMHTSDWWLPHFICHDCIIKIEDVVFGFFVAGIIAVIYNDLFVRRESKENLKSIDIYYGAFLTVGTFVITFLPYFVFHISSFCTTILGGAFLSGGILFRRRDLLKPMFITGLVAVCCSALFYLAGITYNHDWIRNE